jgi:UDP-N-acetyl-D-glucosamine dehydrogenase
MDRGAYRPSDAARDCGGFDVAVVTVPTPLHEGTPDLSYIRESAVTLARYLRPGATVVLESTTYPGTTQELFAPILEDGSGLTAGTDFHLGYSPERIDPGNAVWGFKETPKVVSGVNESSLKAVRDFYDDLVDTTVPVSSPKEAELAKLLENTFRHVNIALVNEIAMFAHHLDIDVWQAIEAASSKPFGFMKFTPGPGVGGHCLPIDPSYLSWRVQRELGQSFRFVELANDINNHMPEYVTRRIIDAFNERRRSVNGSRVLLLGLAYKKNTGDARESPALRITQLLLDMGAQVRAADPHVVESLPVDARLVRVEVTAEELAAADMVVLLTDHDGFDYELVAEHAPFVLDCRRRLSGSNIEVL